MRTPLLLALVGLLAPDLADGQASAGPQTVVVELSSFKFAPTSIVLQTGMAYRLQLENKSSKAHNFTSDAFFASAKVEPEDLSKIKHGGVEIPAGQTVDVQLSPGQPGEYQVKCAHFLHASMGMTGTITVR
jgi:plastocyanin